MPELLNALAQPWVPVVTFLLGLLLGNWLALGRDRRKEFNDAADPVRSYLLLQRAGPSAYGKVPGVLELANVGDRLPRWRRLGWASAWERYQATCQQGLVHEPTYGGAFYPDDSAIVAAIDACLPYVRLR